MTRVERAHLLDVLDGPLGERATARYGVLVEALGRSMSMRYGWRSRAARMLGVSPSYVAKVRAGELSKVGPEIVVRAVERLGVPASYFTGDDDPGPDLPALTPSSPQAEDPDAAAGETLRESFEELGEAAAVWSKEPRTPQGDIELARAVMRVSIVRLAMDTLTGSEPQQVAELAAAARAAAAMAKLQETIIELGGPRLERAIQS